MRTDLQNRLTKALLSKPLVSNAFRGTVVEAIVGLAVEPTWQWKNGGWGGHDFDGPGGLRLEIKQSAARQDWHTPACKPAKARFDIKERTGFYDNDEKWQGAPGRRAHIYIFAWHPECDLDTADHRDPDQWQFFVVPTCDLPAGQKSIGISGVRARVAPVNHEGLLAKLSEVAAGVRAA